MASLENVCPVTRVCDVLGQQLLVRATSTAAFGVDVVVGVALHNQSHSIRACINSIYAQDMGNFGMGILIVNDGSNDDWLNQIMVLPSRCHLMIVEYRCGGAAATRNLALDIVDVAFPEVRWIARLDADDTFTSAHSLAAACQLAVSTSAKFVLGGNRLRSGGHILEKINWASEELLNPAHVLALLRRMAEDTAENELPSCNLLLASKSGWRYPYVQSAEDHWLVAELLLRHSGKGAILMTQLYSDYTLEGSVTVANRRTSSFVDSRKSLYATAVSWVTQR